jgi:DedD protein
MTVRYTAIAGMDDSPLRDAERHIERWRDKLELRLDNRQVFFLFFGSAVVACMLFVLGVMVGKRIESRGQAASPELQDPLAALDRVQKPAPGAAPAAPPQLTFPNQLIGSGARIKPATVKLAALAPAKPTAPKPLIAAPAAVPKAVLASVAAPRPVVAPAAAPKPVVASVAASKPVVTPVVAAKPVTAPAVKLAAAAAAPAADAAKSKGKFTLHLNTFTTPDDANAFAQRYPGAFVISGDIPGKGTTYRVRYGNFPSFKDATAAKETFEKQHGTIALVAAR